VHPEQPPETFTREQLLEYVENARKEEKDKLYETLGTLNNRVKVFEDDRKKLEDEAQAALDAAAEAERLKQQDEQTITERYQALESQWEERFKEQDTRLANQQAVFEKEREFQALAGYRNQRLGELSDQIDPRFHDFITGTTPEEIEASLYIAAQKTSEIGQEVSAAMAAQGFNPGGQPAAPPRPGMPVTSGPGFTFEQMQGGPQEKEMSAADIAAMPMSEYAAYREQLLTAASRQVQERGLYG
jgi:outer membrane murein-binding lipoprotein Lpp